MAVTVDRDSSTGGKLYVDGNLVFTFNPATFTSRTLDNSAPVRLGQTGQGDTYAIYQGQIDEVEIFKRVLSEAELDKIYAAGSAGKCKTTPAVCGNSMCESGETCSSCANDCGACPVCDSDGFCELGEGLLCIDCQPKQDCDNDGICETGENQDTCSDCCDPQFECPAPY